MSENERVKIGIMELVEAKRIKEILAESGVTIELGHNKETCTKGCKVTVEVWTEMKHIPQVQKVMREEHEKLMEGLDVNPELTDEVFDPSEETAICPACGTEFSTESNECPECGLMFKVK